MSGVNKIFLVGHVGADPIVRQMKNGQNVANFTLATSKDFIDKNGEKKSSTQWHRLVCYGPYSKVIETHIKKGMKIYAEGEMEYAKYIDKNGIEKYNANVIIKDFQFLSSAEHRTDSSNEIATQGGSSVSYEFDDDIPF